MTRFKIDLLGQHSLWGCCFCCCCKFVYNLYPLSISLFVRTDDWQRSFKCFQFLCILVTEIESKIPFHTSSMACYKSFYGWIQMTQFPTFIRSASFLRQKSMTNFKKYLAIRLHFCIWESHQNKCNYGCLEERILFKLVFSNKQN